MLASTPWPSSAAEKGYSTSGPWGKLSDSDRGPGGILRETQAPQAIDKTVLETAHFCNMVSDEKGSGCLGTQGHPHYNSRSVSSDRVSRAAWSSDSRTLSPLPALGAAFY